MELQELLDQWFDRGMSLAAEFGGSDAYATNHRQAVLAALDLGLVPPDWPDWLDWMRDDD